MMNIQLKMKKTHLIKGKSAKFAPAFIKNKANFKNNKISVNYFKTGIYEILPAWRGEKTNPIKPNTNPIHKRPKMNANPFNKMIYKNFMPLAGQKTNPIQTQYKLALERSSRGINFIYTEIRKR